MNTTPTRHWTPADICEKIDRSPVWLERAIIAIYQRQTADEQHAGITQHDNGVGFSGADARYLSYVARWILAGRHLSNGHLERARQRMRKYAGQLAKIANGEF